MKTTIYQTEYGVEYRNEKGDFHRTDGPAVVRASGEEEYWIEGVELTEEEFMERA